MFQDIPAHHKIEAIRRKIVSLEIPDDLLVDVRILVHFLLRNVDSGDMRLLAGASADLKERGAIEETASWSLVQAGESLRETLAAMRSPAGLGGPQPPDLQGELRRYQVHGYAWLEFPQRWGLGACLADDMGLGKTIQALALLQLLKDQGREGTSLVVKVKSSAGE